MLLRHRTTCIFGSNLHVCIEENSHQSILGVLGPQDRQDRGYSRNCLYLPLRHHARPRRPPLVTISKRRSIFRWRCKWRHNGRVTAGRTYADRRLYSGDNFTGSRAGHLSVDSQCTDCRPVVTRRC